MLTRRRGCAAGVGGGVTPVPRLLGADADDAGSWIITCALRGRWPSLAMEGRAEDGGDRDRAGTRALHEALPACACPFTWSASHRLADVRRRARLGRLDPARWHHDHQNLGAPAALRLLADIPQAGQVVVCHGDACAPNTLLTEDGRCSGHVDLGSLGVADRWADLAVATWSTTWNYGPGFETRLLDAYGIAPDPDRTRYYRLLYDLSP